MPHKAVVKQAAGLLIALTLLLSSGAPGEALLEQKREVLQQALARNGGEESTQAVLAQAGSAVALTRVDLHHESGALLRLVLEGTGGIPLGLEQAGNTLYLDLYNTVPLATAKDMVLAPHPELQAVEVVLFSHSPHIITRLTLQFHVPVEAHIEEYATLKRVYLRTSDHSPIGWVDMESASFETISPAQGADPEEINSLAATLEHIQAKPGTTVVSAVTEDEAETLSQTLALLQKVTLPAVAAQPVSRAASLHDQLKAVAGVDLELRAGSVAFDATPITLAQASSFAQLSDDMAVYDIEEPDQPIVEEATTPEPPAAPAVTEIAPDESGVEDPEDEEILPPMPRAIPSPGTAEANVAIVGRMQELLEAAQGASPVRPAEGEPVVARREASAVSGAATGGDPLARRVNIDFREMDLVNVVAILASQAGINVIAGTDLQGTVTANLQNVTLRRAIDTVLRTNGLGLLEEEGIYRIVPYDEAIEAQRETVMVSLDNAEADEVQRVLNELVRGTQDQRVIKIAANKAANIVVISGPRTRIEELVRVAQDLDVAEPVLPTVTEPLKLNYANPADMASIIKEMLTPDIGSVSSDERGRFVIVKDVPVVVEQVRLLVSQLDTAVKQVLIDTMVVDVALDDTADTGVNWLLNAVQSQSRRNAAIGPDAPNTGNLQDLGLGTNMPFSQNPASELTFSILTGSVNWSGVISAEIRNQNGRLVSNPVLVAVENTPARISISQEIPYIELRQTAQGGSQTTTEFKEVGTILQVTPTVTHDNHIIVNVEAKESTTAGQFQGVPIEDKRELETNLRVSNGQTIFVGGLRKNANNTTVRKVPVLGNVPVVNFLFRSNQRQERVNELLIFLTCSVVEENVPRLTAYQRSKFETGAAEEVKVDVENNLYRDMIYPGDMRDPAWKWRRP